MTKKSISGAVIIISIFCMVFMPKNTIAQQSLIYKDAYRDYKTAMELYDNAKYAMAQKYFDLASSKFTGATEEEIFTYKANSDYYKSICAIELDNPDAEKLMIDFVYNYPGNALQGSAYNQLGKIYYKKGDYTNAIDWYSKVDVKDLGYGEADTYKFQYAYSLFNKKKFDDARKLFGALVDKQGPYYDASNYYFGFIEYYEGNFNSALKSFDRVKDVKPYSQVVPYCICNIYFAQKQYDKLLEYAEPIMDDTKMNYYAEINQLVGKSYLYKKEYSKAIPYLTYYIEKGKKFIPQDYYQLAFAQHETGDYTSAVNNLKQIELKEDTVSQQSAYLLGDSYIHLNKKEDARNAFMQASRLSFDKTEQEDAIFNYGKLSYELQFYQVAVSSFKDYLNNYPKGKNRAEAQELLARSLLNTKNYDEALAAIKSIPDKSRELKEAYQKVSYYKGVELYNNKNFPDAEKMFIQSLENPIAGGLQAAAYFWLGEIQYQKNEYQKAITNHVKFQELAKVSTDLPEEVTIPFSNYTLGYSYFKNENYSNAVNYFNKTTASLKPNKSNPVENDIALDAILRTGDCYFMTKDYKKAEANYDKIINNNYAGADYALFQKGMLDGLQGDESDKIATMKQLISKFPNSYYIDDAMYETANTYFLEDDNQSAINGFKKLITDKPNSNYKVKALLKLGLIYYNLGDYSTAQDYYKQAYDLSPTTSEGAEALAGVKESATHTGDLSDLKGVVSKSELDSVTYFIAYNKYVKKTYPEAVSSFSDYMKKYPKGFYLQEALYYRADSYVKQEKYTEALADFEDIIDQNKPRFREGALYYAAYIEYYQNKNYKNAAAYYHKLYDVATTKENSYTALKGMLRTAYFMNDFDEVLSDANKILSSDQLTNDERIEANFYSGKAWMEKDNIDKAYDAFSKTALLTTNENGVEARFHMADILFQKGKLDDSKKKCLEIINDMPSYEEWVIRSYILLADISAAKGEYAQAEASLQSIIDSYKGDQDLVDLAKQKLEQVKEMERSGRKSNQNGNDGGVDELNFDNK